MDLKTFAIVIAQQRQNKITFGVRVEIRRNVTYAELAIGRAVVRVRLDKLREWLAVVLAPFAQLARQRIVVVVRMEMNRVDEIAADERVIRFAFGGFGITGDGFRELAAILEYISEIAVGFRE